MGGTVRNRPDKQKGFTIVETVLSIALIGILIVLSSVLLRQGLDSYAHISNRGGNLQSARYAMERMVRELKRAGDKDSNKIQNISSTRITFTDADGNTTNFELIGTLLKRGSDRLLENVTALAFTGFRDNNDQTSSAQQLRRVRIQLTTLPPAETAPLILRTDVFFRNYMYENFQ